MLAALVIVFREVLEAALIIGIILAATKGVQGSRRWIGAGVLAGLLGSALLAGSADLLNEALDGVGQELFTAAILLVAVAMLAWHSIWMTRHGRDLAAQMRSVGHAVSAGARPLTVLAVVVGVAVLREGAETVLFIYGVSASGDEGRLATALGCGLGLLAGGSAGALLYLGLLKIPPRHLFGVTSWLVMLLAAGMAAQAVHFLAAAGVVEVATQPVWDSSGLLSEGSLPGRLAHTLIGYVDRPSLSQIAAYATTLLGISLMSRLARRSAA